MNEFISINSDWGYIGCIGWVNKGVFTVPEGYFLHGITFLFKGWVTTSTNQLKPESTHAMSSNGSNIPPSAY
jgi:hypothetical protein